MHWVWDHTHRFRMRPAYSGEELDAQCDAILSEFLQRKYSLVSFPVATDDLKQLLEGEVDRLQLSADSASEEDEVEATIEFQRGRKPLVKIPSRLAATPALTHRFRATLMHVYGHVRFHDFLFQSEEGAYLSLFDDVADPVPQTNRCTRNSTLPGSDRDWMEWQAGYACGALLMPIGPLIAQVRDFRRDRDLDLAALSDRSLDGATLIAEVAERFDTSWEAARVRLLQQRIVASGDTRSLF